MTGTTGRVALTAAALVLGLTACTGGSGDPGTTERPTEPSASPTATEEPAVDAIETLPDGKLVIETVVRGKVNARADQATVQGQVTVTEDLWLVLPNTQELVALDRETLDEVWRTDLEAGYDRKSGACPLVAPPPDATAITVFSGLECGVLDHYSLETGEHLGSERASEEGFWPNSSGGVRVGDATYWSSDDGIHEVLPDGSTDLLLAPAQLGVDEREFLAGITAIAGTDTMVVHVRHEDRDSNHGTFIGLRRGEEGDLEEVWRRPVDQTIGKRAVPDNTVVRTRMYGVVVNLVRDEQPGRPHHPRMSMFDPETGTVRDRELVLPYDPPGGYPAWIQFDFEQYETRVEADGSVVSAAGAGGWGYDPNVVRYDLAAHEIRWAWRPRFWEHPTAARPLGRSADGEHYYVLSADYAETMLVELDYETGKQQRTWRVPKRAGEIIHSAQGVLAGNQLVLFEPFTTKFSGGLAVALTIQ